MQSSLVVSMRLCLSKKDHANLPVTARVTKKCIDLLQQFFMQESNENSQSDKLKVCVHFVHLQIHIKQL